MTPDVTNEPFFFIQLSDPQLGLTAEKQDISKEEGLAQEVAQFESAISEANRLKPDFVVVTGDLSHHNMDPAEVAEVNRIAGALDSGIPIYWTTGNRDSGFDDGVPVASMLAKYRQEFGDDYYSFDHKGTTFIAISSTVIFDPSQTQDELEAQMEFIETELKASVERGAANRVVFTHHPLFTSDPNEEDTPGALPLVRRKLLLELFHKYDVSAVFAGHLHRNNYASDGDMLMVATTAVGMQAGDDDPGYRVVKVLPNGIQHQYYPFTSGSDSVQLS
jgi:serine/threonine-protein phosphatase CPPED1